MVIIEAKEENITLLIRLYILIINNKNKKNYHQILLLSIRKIFFSNSFSHFHGEHSNGKEETNVKTPRASIFVRFEGNRYPRIENACETSNQSAPIYLETRGMIRPNPTNIDINIS